MGINSGGTIRAAYSTSNISATAGGTAKAGGLVGENSGNFGSGTIIAAWSNGTVTATGATVNRGATVGSGAGTFTDVYWDTDTTGIPDDADNNAPEGKTTSELQTPAESQKSLPNYPTGIYANWNVNVDGKAGNDNPWDFGTTSQYPVLHVRTLPYVLLLNVPTVSWAVSNTTIYESTVGGASRATSTTITPTLSGAWGTDLVYTFPTDAKYTLSAARVTIPAGATTTTGVTLTAVNDKAAAGDATLSLSPTSSHLRQPSTVPAITIKDDDLLAKPTGVRVSVDGTKARVDWTAVVSSTGYRVEWSTSSAFAGSPSSATKTGRSTTNHSVTSGLTSGETYYFRVIATVTGYDDSPPSDAVSATLTTGATDYDADNDGLIEVTTLAQLNAIRYDLDGDGVADDAANATSYASAFPNAEDNMGCRESVVNIASNNTGNPACSGYELSNDLELRHRRRRRRGRRRLR